MLRITQLSGFAIAVGPATTNKTLSAAGGSFALSGAAATLAKTTVDPHFANVVFLSGFEGADAATTLTEESSAARTVTFVGNAQLDTAQFFAGTSSLLLDGTGDLLTAPNSADFQLGSGSWTIECHARWNTLPASGERAVFVSLYDTNSQRSWMAAANNAAGTYMIDFLTSTNGTAGVATLSVGMGAPSTGQWYNFEFNYDGSNIRAFMSGVFKGKAAFASTLFASTAKLSIGGILTSGAAPAGTNNYMNGWIDEMRITKGVCRHPSDSNFTPPTLPFPRS